MTRWLLLDCTSCGISWEESVPIFQAMPSDVTCPVCNRDEHSYWGPMPDAHPVALATAPEGREMSSAPAKMASA